MATETGTANNDTLTGTAGADIFYGLAGNDLLYGLAGNDSVYGGDDGDLIYGGDGTDSLYGDAGADTLYGNDGSGALTARNTIYGGTGADLMYGDSTAVGTNFYAGADTDGDTIYSSANAQFFDIGTADRVHTSGFYNILYGSENNIDLQSVDVNQSVAAIYMRDDAQVIYGGIASNTNFYTNDTQASVIYGGDGGDNLFGDFAQSTSALIINGYADTLYGDAGNDRLYSGYGGDSLVGGSGSDQYYLTHGDATLSEVVGEGNDTVYYNQDYIDDLYGDPNQNLTTADFANVEAVIAYERTTAGEVLYGSDRAESIDGLYGQADTIYAGIGNDSIASYTGNDLIYAGDGDDVILSTQGLADTIYGGDGTDQITFAQNSSSHASVTMSADGQGSVEYASNPGILHEFYGVENFQLHSTNDTFYGAAGDQSVNGGLGADLIYGDAGDDTLVGSAGNDTLYGGDGADRFAFAASSGTDSVYGGDGADSIDLSGVGADITMTGSTISSSSTNITFDSIESFTLGAGNDSVTGSIGAETIDASDGADNITSGAGADSLSGGVGNDTLIGEAGNDTINGGNGNDSIDGGADDDTYMFSDSLGTSFGDDTLSDSAGNDSLMFDAGFIDDLTVTLGAAAGAGTISSAAGTVALTADIESFTLGSGADNFDGTAVVGTGRSVDGGAGADTIVASDFDDTLIGGAGGDELFGGAGNDVFAISSDYLELFGDSIVGGTGDDTIDAGNVSNHMDVVYQGGDTTSGDLNFYSGIRDVNGDFNVAEFIGSATFSGIEAITPCFTPGALVATPRGPVAVEDLRPGDRVMTRDNGACEIAWAGRSPVSQADLAAQPRLRPVRIRAGALGNGLPERDMMLSPNHQVLMSGRRAQLYFAEHEVLLAAKHLVGRPGITRVLPEGGVDYVHFMFERHEVVLADGVWSESFQPGDQSLAGLDEDQRHELLTLFPALANAQGTANYTAARRILRRYEARVMLG